MKRELRFRLQSNTSDAVVIGGGETIISYRSAFNSLSVMGMSRFGSDLFVSGVGSSSFSLSAVELAHSDPLPSSRSFLRLGSTYSGRSVLASSLSALDSVQLGFGGFWAGQLDVSLSICGCCDSFMLVLDLVQLGLASLLRGPAHAGASLSLLNVRGALLSVPELTSLEVLMSLRGSG